MKLFASTLVAATSLLVCTLASAQNAKPAESLEPEAAATYQYAFTEVNYPGDTFTQLLGINNNSIVAGYHGSGLDPANPNKGFTYSPISNTFTAENYPNSAQTQVIGINDAGYTSGFWVDSKGNNYGFYQFNGRFYNVVYPGTTFNQLLGFNNNDIATGYSQDSAGNFHPYSTTVSPAYTSYLLPGTVSAQATATTNTGAVVGFYIDSKGVTHGFQFINGNFHSLDYPGATATQCLGSNDANWIVGSYTDASGINNAGAIVGFWGNTAAGISHGFIGTLPAS